MLMDDRELAAAFSDPSAGGHALSGATLRKGMVTAIAADGTITATIGGSATAVSGIRVWSNVCPKVGAAIWLAWLSGTGLMAVGTEAPVGNARARVRRTTDQNIADGTDVLVGFGNPPGNIIDPWGMYSQPNTLIVPVPGVYAITFNAKFSGHATGYRRASIFVNGSTIAIDNRSSVGAATPTVVNPSTLWTCAQGDQIQVEVRQSSGVTLQLVAGGASDTRLSVTWLGAA